jgi:6-phosphogluconolactonase/glucosamine-6-phosphate isomerase/deaminase
MGIRTIFNSKRIIMMAWGIQKSHIVKKSVENKYHITYTYNIPSES